MGSERGAGGARAGRGRRRPAHEVVGGDTDTSAVSFFRPTCYAEILPRVVCKRAMSFLKLISFSFRNQTEMLAAYALSTTQPEEELEIRDEDKDKSRISCSSKSISKVITGMRAQNETICS
ncbi:hypothetical protein EVAR_20096_1 [Eumeta japonica]|uniref:Uncharacterized protein n=1 Tax=Eumeta variegata TaxID=151549 RepID=A0A4C1V2Z9_EUMVA|nr:hypothetical protein EVAR_20096_1 [Eumeta japonica]